MRPGRAAVGVSRSQATPTYAMAEKTRTAGIRLSIFMSPHDRPKLTLSPISRSQATLMHLDVASDQGDLRVDIGESPDAERVHRPRLAAIIDIRSEPLHGRAGRPDPCGHAGERGVLTSGRRRSDPVYRHDQIGR